MHLLILLILACSIIAILTSPHLRCVLSHPLLSIAYTIKDTYKYIRFCRWREFKGYGQLVVYTGLFGQGKTLMSVKYLRAVYKKYNNKRVYDFNEKKWKIQHIYIVSNVQIKDIPTIPLNDLSNDMIMLSSPQYNDGVSCYIFFVDEMSTQLNSRNFKENFTTELLNVLLTCRHYRMSLIGTSQRFMHIDKLCRTVTSTTSDMRKLWRLVLMSTYDAWTLENISDINKVKPIKQHCYFITDKDYNAYDTYSVVENFKDNVLSGNVLTDLELAQLIDSYNNVDSELYLKKKFRKKLHK